MSLRPEHKQRLLLHVRQGTVKVSSPSALVRTADDVVGEVARMPLLQRMRRKLTGAPDALAEKMPTRLDALDKITHTAGMLSVPAGIFGYGYHKLTQPSLPNRPLY